MGFIFYPDFAFTGIFQLPAVGHGPNLAEGMRARQMGGAGADSSAITVVGCDGTTGGHHRGERRSAYGRDRFSEGCIRHQRRPGIRVRRVTQMNLLQSGRPSSGLKAAAPIALFKVLGNSANCPFANERVC